MQQGGVTDINTAKTIARKLYMQYCNGGQMEKMAMERMLVDTYRVMVPTFIFRTKHINLPRMISISTTKFLTSIEMVELLLMISRLWLLNTLLEQRKSKKILK
jgi:hypothetical protein